MRALPRALPAPWETRREPHGEGRAVATRPGRVRVVCVVRAMRAEVGRGPGGWLPASREAASVTPLRHALGLGNTSQASCHGGGTGRAEGIGVAEPPASGLMPLVTLSAERSRRSRGQGARAPM